LALKCARNGGPQQGQRVAAWTRRVENGRCFACGGQLN